MSEFREMATALVGDDVVATANLDFQADGSIDRSVRIWAVADQVPRAGFETVLDFGGGRLALAREPDRLVVVTGAWERHGICAYDAGNGERLWQRKDLRQPQHVSPARDGAVAACFDRRPMHVLDVGAGTTVVTIRGVRRFWQSPYRQIGAGEVQGHVALIDTDGWTVRSRVPVAGFALLAAAFAPDAVLIANTVDFDSGDDRTVYCLSPEGDVRWAWRTPVGTNVPWIGYDAEADEWLGIRQHVERQEPKVLLRWNRDGELVARNPLNRGRQYTILPGGRLVVAAGGELIDTRSAGVVGRLIEQRSAIGGS